MRASTTANNTASNTASTTGQNPVSSVLGTVFAGIGSFLSTYWIYIVIVVVFLIIIITIVALLLHKHPEFLDKALNAVKEAKISPEALGAMSNVK